MKQAGRTDLIGFDKMCLIRPRQFAKEKQLLSKDKQGQSRGGTDDKRGKSASYEKARKPGSGAVINGKRDNFHDKKRNDRDEGRTKNRTSGVKVSMQGKKNNQTGKQNKSSSGNHNSRRQSSHKAKH